MMGLKVRHGVCIGFRVRGLVIGFNVRTAVYGLRDGI